MDIPLNPIQVSINQQDCQNFQVLLDRSLRIRHSTQSKTFKIKSFSMKKKNAIKNFKKGLVFFSQILESLNRLNFRVKLGRKKSQALRSLNSEFYDD